MEVGDEGDVEVLQLHSEALVKLFFGPFGVVDGG